MGQYLPNFRVEGNVPMYNQWRRHGLKCGYAESEYEAQMAKSGGGGEFLEKGMWASSHQLEDRIWCILGCGHRIKMVNR